MRDERVMDVGQIDEVSRHARRRGTHVAGAAAAVAMLLLTGCAGTTAETKMPSVAPEATNSPDFSGPFAAEYAQAWAESGSDFVRLVIGDEQISEQEWAEVEGRMATCFAGEGATFEGHTSDGGYAAQKNSLSSDRLNEVMGECEKSSGEAWLGYLWFSAQKNPQNRPAEEIITECMIRTGVVASDYTAEDFVRDNPTMSFPYLGSGKGQKGFLACNADPRTGS